MELIALDPHLAAVALLFAHLSFALPPLRMLKIGLLALLRCHDLGDDVNPSSG